MKYLVPFSYEMYGKIEVEAENEEAAKKAAEEKLDKMSVAEMAENAVYLFDSEEIDPEGIFNCGSSEKTLCSDCVCKHCINGICQLSTEDDAYVACDGTLDDMEECNYVDGFGIENMTLDSKVVQVRKDAAEIEKILAGCKNIRDIRNLRHISGVFSEGIMIFDGEGWFDLNKYLDGYIPKRVQLKAHGDFLEYPTYDYQDKLLYFNNFDSSFDDDYAILEDCTLANFEKAYREYVEKAEKV